MAATQVTCSPAAAALYAILRAIDIRPGDEVILPAFTCVAVPNAVLHAGARPVGPTSIRRPCVRPGVRGCGRHARAIPPRTRSACPPTSMLGPSPRAPAQCWSTTAPTGSADLSRPPNGATAPLAFFDPWSKPISTGLGASRSPGTPRPLAGCASSRRRPRSRPAAVLALRRWAAARSRAVVGSSAPAAPRIDDQPPGLRPPRRVESWPHRDAGRLSPGCRSPGCWVGSARDPPGTARPALAIAGGY